MRTPVAQKLFDIAFIVSCNALVIGFILHLWWSLRQKIISAKHRPCFLFGHKFVKVPKSFDLAADEIVGYKCKCGKWEKGAK